MFSGKLLSLGVILPHTKIFGGVKRFLEIGNILISKGHTFHVFTPDGKAPEWFPFRGQVVKLEEIGQYTFDALFTTEPAYIGQLRAARATLRVFYAVLQRRHIRKAAKVSDLLVIANSEGLYRYLGGPKRNNVFKAVGGIDTDRFDFQKKRPRKKGEPLVVLVYGRFYRKKKGTRLVVRACEALYRRGYELKLHLFDAPVDEDDRKRVNAFTCKLPFRFFVDHPVEKTVDLYHGADIFVSAERNAGWSNTSAEAMACGLPVIATKSGTKDFLSDGETGLITYRHPWFIGRAIRRMYNDERLGARLALNARRKIEEYSWKKLAATIEQLILSKLSDQQEQN